MWKKARFVALDPLLAFAVVAWVVLVVSGWAGWEFDGAAALVGASISTVLTVALRWQEVVWPPGDEPTPPGSEG